jgi:hypothetical protein
VLDLISTYPALPGSRGRYLQYTTKMMATGFVAGLLAGCVVVPPPVADLKTARETCNRQYLMRVGNYLPHARCVNAAIETYAMPGARYPDLVQLQAEARVLLSEKIDRRVMSAQAGERRMAEVDRLVAAAERDRDAGNDAAASTRVRAVERIIR